MAAGWAPLPRAARASASPAGQLSPGKVGLGGPPTVWAALGARRGLESGGEAGARCLPLPRTAARPGRASRRVRRSRSADTDRVSRTIPGLAPSLPGASGHGPHRGLSQDCYLLLWKLDTGFFRFLLLLGKKGGGEEKRKKRKRETKF